MEDLRKQIEKRKLTTKEALRESFGPFLEALVDAEREAMDIETAATLAEIDAPDEEKAEAKFYVQRAGSMAQRLRQIRDLTGKVIGLGGQIDNFSASE